MPVETPSLFAQIIQEHLELKRRNATLEPQMPLDRYMSEDPFENHPLFKTEEQARVEDTMSGQETILHEETSLDWPAADDTFIVEPEEAPVPVAPEAEVEAEAAAEAAEPEHAVEGAEPVPDPEAESESDEGLWTRSRDFDWGD